MAEALAELKRIFGDNAVHQTTVESLAAEQRLSWLPADIREKQIALLKAMQQEAAATVPPGAPLYTLTVNIKNDSRMVFPQKREDIATDLQSDAAILLEAFIKDAGLPVYAHDRERIRVPHNENKIIMEAEGVQLIHQTSSKDPVKSSVSSRFVFSFRAEDIEKPEVIEKLKQIDTGQLAFLTDQTLSLNDRVRLMEEYQTIRLLNRASGNTRWKVEDLGSARVFMTREKIKNPKAVIDILNKALGSDIPSPRSPDNSKVAFETKIVTSQNRANLDGLSFGDAAAKVAMER